jgi:hypothetical protein
LTSDRSTRDIRVWLGEDALASVFRSSYEVYWRIKNCPKGGGESPGMLYGKTRGNEDYLELRVTSAQPPQVVEKRQCDLVQLNHISLERMQWTPAGMKVLGDYHSHVPPYCKPILTSPDDKSYLSEHPFTRTDNGRISVVIAMHDTMHETELTVDPCRISGSVAASGGRELYHVAIQAFYLSKPNPETAGRILRAQMRFDDGALDRMFHNGVLR